MKNNNLKLSFVATVLNEEHSIEAFVKSILLQTKKPDEIIIVDGGSTDKTLEKLKQFKQIKVLNQKGNRSVGRNFAISKALGSIVLVSDAGCILNKNWVKEIVNPFNDPLVDVVSGYYYPVTKTIFQKCLATYTCVMPDRVNPYTFLPSSRSIAFKKSVWKKIKYPQNLDTCEDLILDRNLKKAGYKFKFIKKAFVYWRQQNNIFAAAKLFYNYAKGDGKAHYFRPQTPLLFARYIFGFSLLFIYIESKNIQILNLIVLLIFLYLLWSIWKNYRYIRHIKAFLYLPLLQMISDIAVISGTTVGLVESYFLRTTSHQMLK